MQRPYILQLPTTGGWETTHESDVFRKELVYPGFFLKKDENGAVEFELPVDEALIDHWVATFNAFKTSGIEVPVPVEHTTDPEQRRGTVVALRKEHNSKRQGPSLYSYIKFRNAKDAQDMASGPGTSTQVSLYSPPTFTDGTGKKYVRPITHVALTDYPLIPGLEGFERLPSTKHVAASLTFQASDTETDDEENDTMKMSQLARRLGVKHSVGASSSKIAAAIVKRYRADSELEDDEDDFGLGLDDELEEDDEFDMDNELEDELEEDDEFDMDNEFDDELDDEEEMPMSRRPRRASVVSASLAKTVAGSRKTEIQQLVRDGKISPLVGQKLAKKYASKRNVAICLSHESRGKRGDDFSSVVAALSLNDKRYRYGERTHAQMRGESGDGNPMTADAERRAEEAEKRNARKR